MEATSGIAEVFGSRPREPALADRLSHAGVQPLSRSHASRKTSATSAICAAFLRAEIDERGHRYLRMFDMDRFANRLAGRLSGGMKQKLSLACALVAEPRVLLLDEPTTGVDPVSRREFWDTLAHLAADGLTILVATPYLDEAERCHRVALMHLGEIREIGTPAELRAELCMQRGWKCAPPNLGEAEESLAARQSIPTTDIIDVQRFGDRLDVLVHDPDEAGRR